MTGNSAITPPLGNGVGGGIFNDGGMVDLVPGSVVTKSNVDNCEPNIGTCT